MSRDSVRTGSLQKDGPNRDFAHTAPPTRPPAVTCHEARAGVVSSAPLPEGPCRADRRCRMRRQLVAPAPRRPPTHRAARPKTHRWWRWGWGRGRSLRVACGPKLLIHRAYRLSYAARPLPRHGMPPPRCTLAWIAPLRIPHKIGTPRTARAARFERSPSLC